MIKAEWGTKRTCPKCGTRFYDLGAEDPVTCINCGNSWVPEPILKSKQTLPFETEKAAGKPAESEGDAALEADDLDIDTDADEPADDSDVDIGGDDSDLSEVVVEDKEDDR
ncbi:MAG: TIGR02300 family protein [Thermaurantiacus sp.]